MANQSEAARREAGDKALLRAWRHPLVALVVATALVVLTAGALSALFRMAPAGFRDPWGGALPALVSVAVLFALYKLVIRKLGDRRHDDLPLTAEARDLPIGIGGGVLVMSVAVGLAALVGIYRIAGWGSGEDAAMIVFQGGVSAAFVEELLFRGILFRWLEEYGGSWAALAFTSLLFGMGHAFNQGATVFSTVAIMFEAGILLGAAYMYARNLWLPIGVHFGWNVTEGYIFDVPVSGHPVRGLVEARVSGPEWLSGGAFGLEASVIALLACTAAGVALLVLAVRRDRLVAPRWRRTGAS